MLGSKPRWPQRQQHERISCRIVLAVVSSNDECGVVVICGSAWNGGGKLHSSWSLCYSQRLLLCRCCDLCERRGNRRTKKRSQLSLSPRWQLHVRPGPCTQVGTAIYTTRCLTHSHVIFIEVSVRSFSLVRMSGNDRTMHLYVIKKLEVLVCQLEKSLTRLTGGRMGGVELELYCARHEPLDAQNRRH